jgi:hypothetical protein
MKKTIKLIQIALLFLVYLVIDSINILVMGLSVILTHIAKPFDKTAKHIVDKINNINFK